MTAYVLYPSVVNRTMSLDFHQLMNIFRILPRKCSLPPTITTALCASYNDRIALYWTAKNARGHPISSGGRSEWECWGGKWALVMCGLASHWRHVEAHPAMAKRVRTGQASPLTCYSGLYLQCTMETDCVKTSMPFSHVIHWFYFSYWEMPSCVMMFADVHYIERGRFICFVIIMMLIWNSL